LHKRERTLYLLMLVILCSLTLAGVILEGPEDLLGKLLLLQTRGARLISDFTVHGVGLALLNVASVGFLGLVLVYFAAINLSGPTLATIMTMMGFSFFGNTLYNSVPVIIGVFLASKLAKVSFGSYSIIALFGTAIAPIVTYLSFEIGLTSMIGIPLGIACGIGIGFILPAIAGTLLNLHQGYSLYNVGFACGFVGLFIASILNALDLMHPMAILWNESSSPALTLVVPVMSLYFIITAFILERPGEVLSGFLGVQGQIGRLPSDYYESESPSGTLLNIAVLGLIYWLYVLGVGAPMNGPVLGGLLTIMGFGGFGKNVKNTIPIVLGVFLTTLLLGNSPSSPSPILAALFSTTLAPLAGQFGFFIGILAGAIHVIVVDVTASWHGGLDLYNNGFAGGLTASLIISVIHWLNANRTRRNAAR
jgi:hypothetical protein